MFRMFLFAHYFFLFIINNSFMEYQPKLWCFTLKLESYDHSVVNKAWELEVQMLELTTFTLLTSCEAIVSNICQESLKSLFLCLFLYKIVIFKPIETENCHCKRSISKKNITLYKQARHWTQEECYVWSIALYDSETWRLRNLEWKYLKSFEICAGEEWRR